MTSAPDALVVTAALPVYRRQFVELLSEQLPGLVWFAGDALADRTVRTDLPASLYSRVHNRYMFGRRAFLQTGVLVPAVRARVAVVDLNPRSLTAWLLLVTRRGLGRPTYVWGHLYPRAGSESRTVRLRAAMRRLARGTITYTLSERDAVRVANPDRPAWAATNALYTRRQLQSVDVGGAGQDVLYVGRLVPDKKPELLLRAFAAALPDLPEQTCLRFVGEGASEHALRALTLELGVQDRTTFAGSVYAFESLATQYAAARVLVSPGYVGLTLTQSLGFGVPVLLPRDEPHAPEIELAEDEPLVTWFDKDDASSLARALLQVFSCGPARAQVDAARQKVMATYSADSMAAGFECALAGAA